MPTSIVFFTVIVSLAAAPAAATETALPAIPLRTVPLLSSGLGSEIAVSGAGIQAEFTSIESSLAGLDQPAVEKSCQSHARCRPYYVQADAMFWHRVGNGCDQDLIVDAYYPIPGDDALLTTRDLDFDYEPGLRVLVGWLPDPCHGCGWCCAWELSYFGIYGWEAGATVTGDGNLSLPGIAGLVWNNFGLADEIRADYDSQLHNLELNCVKSCCLDQCTHIDFLCGFRFVTLQEDFSLIGTDFQEGSSSYDVSTENYLYGLQLGGRLRWHWQRWAVELMGKAGVFVNDAGQSQRATDFPNNPDANVVRSLIGSDGQNAAALGELGITFIRPISGRWSARLGYQVVGIGGLALAPDQLDFNDTFTSGSRLHKDGWLLLHGVHAGVEARW